MHSDKSPRGWPTACTILWKEAWENAAVERNEREGERKGRLTGFPSPLFCRRTAAPRCTRRFVLTFRNTQVRLPLKEH